MAFFPDQVQRLVAAGRVDEAATLVMAAAEAGEADALFTLASWRVSGQLVRRDLPEARALMGRAAAAGRQDAALLHACFLANGTGGERKWHEARALLTGLAADFPQLRDQLDLVAQMAVGGDGRPSALPPLERLGDAPQVSSAKALLSPDECDYLIRQAEPQLRPSVVEDRASGRWLAHPDRKCDNMLFGVAGEDLAVSAIRQRVAALAGVDVAQTEPLQIIRYRPGDEFRPHMDALGPGENQRIMTLLVYLTEAYRGGETRFLRSGLTFRGRRGDALLFRNALDDGKADPMAEHAGMPVLEGTKIILSCWIRAEAYAFPPPQPLSRRY